MAEPEDHFRDSVWLEDVEWDAPNQVSLEGEDVVAAYEKARRRGSCWVEHPEEGDPLSDETDAGSECEKPKAIAADPDEEEGERNFCSLKPWLGSIKQPSNYRGDPAKMAAPVAKLDLDYVHGYRSRDCRDNAHWVDVGEKIVFPAAAVAIVYKIGKTNDQDFFLGHDDDILTMDYNKNRRLVASGSIGEHKTCRLCIWNVDTLEQLHCLTGFHEFAVRSVAFTPSGNKVISIGNDIHHSCAIYDVDSGVMLANYEVDKNKVIHIKPNLLPSLNPEQHFVTLGFKHIMFWSPEEPGKKSSKMYWLRGVGHGVGDTCLTSVDYTSRCVVVGDIQGFMFVFHGSTHQCTMVIAAHKDGIISIRPVGPNEIMTGSKDGLIRFFTLKEETHTITSPKSGGKDSVPMRRETKVVITHHKEKQINVNLLDEATDNDSDRLVNKVRSLSYDSNTGAILCGTILNNIYSIPLNGGTSKARTIIGAHWGALGAPSDYGEIWGVASHPNKLLVATTSDDAMLRVWDLAMNRCAYRRDIKFRGRSVAYNNAGTAIAVGHKNGAISVYSADLTKVLCDHVRNRTGRCNAIRFSPNDRYVAVACTAAVVDIYDVSKGYKRIGICKGNTSTVLQLDWNTSSTIIQTASRSYEMLYFKIPECRQVTSARALSDEEWDTQTCVFGWSVQGIWPKFGDGTDINSVSRSNSHQYLAATDDWGRVKLFNFPVVGSGMDRFGRLSLRPEHDVYIGHCSHVTNCTWTFDDQYLMTVGGGDLALFRWKVRHPEGVDPPPIITKRDPALHHDPSFTVNTSRSMKSAASTSTFSAHGMTADQSTSAASTGAGSPVKMATMAKRGANLPPPVCSNCQYIYEQLSQAMCPHCKAPRKMVLAGKGGTKVQSRYLDATDSVARRLKEAKKTRAALELKPANERHWKTPSPQDADKVPRDLLKVKKAKKKPMPAGFFKVDLEDDPKPKKPKKCSGPDYCDF